jgi:hypothetical protein
MPRPPRPIPVPIAAPVPIPVSGAVAARILSLHPDALKRARLFAARTPASPAIRKAAESKAKAAVETARDKALTARGPSVAARIAAVDGLMAAARARVEKRSNAMRTPAQVIQSVLGQIDPGSRPPKRREQTTLLVRSDEPDTAAFTTALAKTLGSTAAGLRTRGILVRQVYASRDGRGAVYSVRLPVKRSSMTTEVHNFAWALRKSGSFRSVRPDGGWRMIFAARPAHAERAERVFAWSHVMTRTDLAHDLPPAATGAALGEGIVIAHPDTGWTSHPNFNGEQIDQTNSYNAGTRKKGASAAETSSAFEDSKVFNLNHGTSTASIMVGAKSPRNRLSTIPEKDLVLAANRTGGRDYGSTDKVADRNGSLVGVAPKATIRPIKFIDDVHVDLDSSGINGVGVVRFFDEDLVEALEYARTSGAHVVSLSVGGLLDSSVGEAIDDAVEANIIVVAAAGQTYTGEALNMIAGVGEALGFGGGDTVVLPAAYSNVIAVAGCTQDGRPWDESLRGPNVDITAPCDAMWVADFELDEIGRKRTPVLEAAGGTSYAAAFMAGVAALWLGHWGRAHLLEKYKGGPWLAWVFRHQLQKTAGTVHSGGWDTGLYGPGIVDVLALLKEPLPEPGDVPAPPVMVENALTGLAGLPDLIGGGDGSEAVSEFVGGAAMIPGQLGALGAGAWAAAYGTARAVLATGEKALADLHAYAAVRGGEVDAAARDSIDGMTALVEEAAEAAIKAKEAVADEAEKKVEEAVDLVESRFDAVGEAAADLGAYLFGPKP